MRTLLLVVAVLIAPLGAPASAVPCEPGEGVTVVVDASALNGDVTVTCVSGEPSNGIEALRAAGHTVTPIQAFAEFVCRIDGQPAADQEPCVNTPPASAFWGYWQAEPGEDWETSQKGAYQSTPVMSGAEGWSFGSGDPPSVPPRNHSTTTTSAAGGPATTPDGTSGTTTSIDPPVATSAPTAESDSSPGPWPTVIGLIAVGVLGTGAFIWTRRRGDDA